MRADTGFTTGSCARRAGSFPPRRGQLSLKHFSFNDQSELPSIREFLRVLRYTVSTGRIALTPRRPRVLERLDEEPDKGRCGASREVTVPFS